MKRTRCLTKTIFEIEVRYLNLRTNKVDKSGAKSGKSPSVFNLLPIWIIIGIIEHCITYNRFNFSPPWYSYISRKSKGNVSSNQIRDTEKSAHIFVKYRFWLRRFAAIGYRLRSIVQVIIPIMKHRRCCVDHRFQPFQRNTSRNESLKWRSLCLLMWSW